MPQQHTVRVGVAVATMNLIDSQSLVKRMRITGDYLIVNQITKESSDEINTLRVKSYRERGLSRSRNRAIEHLQSDILVVADDDMYYAKEYENVIADAYIKYPDADIIAFYVDNEITQKSKPKRKEGRLNRLQTMQISSWQITFRRQSVRRVGLHFDEKFGTGTDRYMGEENIFLFDAVRKGLRIYYVPQKIATLMADTESTWFEGYSEKYFYVRGATFCRMQPQFTFLLILQFALRKHHLYKGDTSFLNAVSHMIKGARSERA